MSEQARTIRGYWDDEMNSALLYEALAARAHGDQKDILLQLAAAERRHAAHWAGRLRTLGLPPPNPGSHRPSPRTRVLGWLGRRLGPGAVLPLVQQAEISDAGRYDHAPGATSAMAADERIHARVLTSMSPAQARSTIGRRERWHRGDASGALRAAVFGVSDGLVSNLALVMGVAGGAAAAVGGNQQFVLLAGMAGLLAGAFSMAAGEYISMTSQRELFERELKLEAAEIDAMPDEERNELALIYRAKGFSPEEAATLATRVFSDRDRALDTMAREELGLDPEELGSPWRAAASSFVAFTAGAAVPVIPYVFGGGTTAFLLAALLSALALFAVGAGVSLLTGRSLLVSGGRQLLVGALAAGTTYLVGTLIGVSVS